MHTLIFDIGCSNTKCLIYEGARQCEHKQHPTPTNVADLQTLVNELRYQAKKNTSYFITASIVVSSSDAVIFEMKDGTLGYILPDVQLPRQPKLPAYHISGKPTNSELPGIANQLYWLRQNIGLKYIKRALPISTFFAAQLAHRSEWKTWEHTHASNSGLWNHEEGIWCQEMAPFIEAGILNEKVASPYTALSTDSTSDIQFLGGHDSVFANANDTPYSAKPYLSLGTWITASVESYFQKRDPQHDTRFVTAPNGSTLEQLCFKNPKNAYPRIFRLFERHLGAETQPRQISVFGTWTDEVIETLQSHPYLHFVVVDRPKEFLHQQIAQYVHEQMQQNYRYEGADFD